MKAYYNISHSYAARRKIRKKLQRTKGEHMKMLCAQTSELMRHIQSLCWFELADLIKPTQDYALEGFEKLITIRSLI